MGLLSPARTETGARVYSAADLQTLVQIVALKSVGVPLKRIGHLRTMGPHAMAEALEAERRELERRQPLLDRVIFAIRNVESALGRGEEADPAILKPLMAALKTDDAGVSLVEEGPAQAPSPAREELQRDWQALLAEIERADQLDPSGPESQELAQRWDLLMTRSTGGGSYRVAMRIDAQALEGAPSTRAFPGEQLFLKIGAALSRLAATPDERSGPVRREEAG